MREIIFIEHSNRPGSDLGYQHLEKQGFKITSCRPFLGEKLPELNEKSSGVIVTGGPQFITELKEFPYLLDEIVFVEKMMTRQIPVLGICLGAQMVAHIMGAHVGFHPEGHLSFGYYKLKPTSAGKEFMPQPLYAAAGNVQGFDHPHGAELLVEGDMFPNQAFRVGSSTYAIQFHPELTRLMLDKWQEEYISNYSKPGAQSRKEQDEGYERYTGAVHTWYTNFLDKHFAEA
ncbi:MAG: hypothetical protein GY786_14080 [Proteobacteria bacterium]|nr:hypothetical protein [Pseudomonadota bacterium]